MSTFVGDNYEPTDPAPAGPHQAVCVDVNDLGMCQTMRGLKRKVLLSWQIEALQPALRADGSTNPHGGKRYVVHARYTASMNPKAKLYQALVAWRGADFTEAERKNFDLDRVIGFNCVLQLVHNPGDNGRVYANVIGIMPILPSMQQMAPLEYVMKRHQQPAANGNGNGQPAQQATPPPAQQTQQLAPPPAAPAPAPSGAPRF